MAKTPEQLAEQIAKATSEIIREQQQIVVEAMLEFNADLKTRIFLDGQDNGGQKIGSYSTEPYYASLKQRQVKTSRLRGQGKNSKDPKFKNGKPRKSMYLQGGYSEFRQVVGRQNAYVDLDLTGQLRESIGLGSTEGNVVVGIRSELEAKKAEGNEKRFGKVIFAPTEEELQKITDAWANRITDIWFSAFD